MFDVFGDRVMRCSDNHLFIASQGSRLFGSIHLGPFRTMQCPVDGKIGMCGNVDRSTLTPGAVGSRVALPGLIRSLTDVIAAPSVAPSTP